VDERSDAGGQLGLKDECSRVAIFISSPLAVDATRILGNCREAFHGDVFLTVRADAKLPFFNTAKRREHLA
jgi:hypothetical protein